MRQPTKDDLGTMKEFMSKYGSEWYPHWYNSQPERKKCPYCGVMVEMMKDSDGSFCLGLKHKSDCDTKTEI